MARAFLWAAKAVPCLAKASPGVAIGLLRMAGVLPRRAGVSRPSLYFPAAKRRVMNWRTFGILVLVSNWMAVVLLAAMTGSVAYQ